MDTYAEVLDDMVEMVLIEDANGIIKYANKAFCDCHGISQGSVVGTSCFDYILPEDRSICNMEEVVTPEEPNYRIEGRAKRYDGKIIWIQYVGRAYFDENGCRTEFREIGVDITKWKKRLEEKTKELEKANQIILKLGPKTNINNLKNASIRKVESNLYAIYKFSDILTLTPKMKILINYAKSVAKGNAAILIEGESGTGKELFAQAIHNESQRANGPFVAVNCGAIPAELVGSEFFGYVEGAFTGAAKGGKPGKFELASGGTLFLDEIGEMPFAQQVALLRVLETKTVTRVGGDKVIPIDIRLICATNRNLLEEVKSGRFRRDLYYRLNVVNLRIPPLRERKDDIFLLVGAFIKRYGRKMFNRHYTFNDNQLLRFYEYDWPGNVRELQNIVERMMYMTGVEIEEFFPMVINTDQIINKEIDKLRETSLQMSHKVKEGSEKEEIQNLIKEYEGNLSMVARKLDISRNTLYKKIKKFGISK
ncbi:sigma-54 interaction domain-containing protein [Anaerovorax sp. IOR16]|uniref:sigma-54 interaction domain-containing protein n=1 Tax=Anaerovorax sp. IOR16 TaxID=2773458 RepID=UPI0019D00ED0|nr:sigma 54-interacting transcriptional regulator [Anaerovorax sp. IOR16]